VGKNHSGSDAEVQRACSILAAPRTIHLWTDGRAAANGYTARTIVERIQIMAVGCFAIVHKRKGFIQGRT
jgi:hypothetical protein